MPYYNTPFEVRENQKKISELLNEKVFLLPEIHGMLKALGCITIDQPAISRALNKFKLKASDFGLRDTLYKPERCFYRLTHVWEYLKLLEAKEKIFLQAEGLTQPTDLISFVNTMTRERNYVSHSPYVRKHPKDDWEPGWENGIKILEK